MRLEILGYNEQVRSFWRAFGIVRGQFAYTNTPGSGWRRSPQFHENRPPDEGDRP